MPRISAKKGRQLPLPFVLLFILWMGITPLPAGANTYQLGDVFVAVGNGKIQHRNAAGALLETLDTLQGGFTTGMAFDSFGNLYVTNFDSGNVRKFNNMGGLIGTFGSGYSGHPESIVFDRNGNTYVGAVDGDNHIRKFDPSGNALGQFAVATEDRGSDWIDLAADQCTMFYTSEGPHVKRFNVCTNTQLSDFSAGALPGAVAYALRILPNGEVLVADTSVIIRLDSSGNVAQQYDSAGQDCWFALNLDPDGKSFWSADYCTSTVHRFDIQSGQEILPSFSTGTAPFTVFGLAVFGEFTGSQHFLLQSTFGSPGSQNPSGTSAEPVNTGTGNYYYSRTDLLMSGRGLPFAFTRFYNSLDTYTGPLGAGWTHSYNVFLTATASGLIIVKEADGHEALFAPLGGGSYSSQTKGDFDTLLGNANGTFALTRKNQTVLTFSSAGKLLKIADRNGNTQVLQYDGFGNLTSITDTVGRSTVLSYDGNNRIMQITDPIGRTIGYAYSPAGDLVKVTDPAGGITSLVYDTNHRVTSITLPNGKTLLQNSYDALGRVSSQTNGRGFTTSFAYGTPNPDDTTIIDPLGNQTIHTYDSSLRIVKITDPAGGTASFAYDANNDRTGVSNPNGKTTNFVYDGQGNVTGVTDPLGNLVAFSYDAKNDLLTTTNAKGHTTVFSYDGNGNLTAIQDALGDTTAFAYDGFGELKSKTDARGSTTTYSYDAYGNLTQITDPLSHSTALTYDGISRLTSIRDPNGHAATAVYDALSRLVKIADPLGNQTRFAYDAVGNLLKITDANGHATSYAYDATNNLVSVTDALGHITRYAYDANNNRVTFTNAKGNATSYAYDVLNRLTRITDPLLFVTSYSYDSVGNVLSTTDAKAQTNQFTYDALNRLLTIAYADGKSVAYAYDADGDRTSMADSHGTTTYAYDALDRLLSVTNPGGKVVTYAHDAVGNRKSLSYLDGKVVAYTYDPTNRLSRLTDWLGRSTAYTYDPAGNLTKSAYPNGATSALSYDPANRLTKIVNSLKNPLPLTLGYTLDGVGNRTALTINGIATKYSYDALNELVVAQSGPMSSTWSYDAAGNRTQASSLHGPINYTYDADDRLLAAGSTTFTYDANGNQTSVARPWAKQPVVYSYDAANRLIAATGCDTNGAFAYDGDGNRISQSVENGTYDYLNDVATALPVVLQESGPDGNISYAYGLGLISESSAKFDYFYHYDGLGSVITLSDALGRPAAAYLYNPWGNPLLIIPDSVGTKNKFRFTGEALDPGTGLYYLRARYYDPAIGRFTSRDPFPGWLANPLSLDRYTYTLNNPANFIDPSGLSSTQLQLASMTSFFPDTWVWLKETIKFLCGPLCSGAAAGHTITNVANEAKQFSTDEGLIKKLGDIYSNRTPYQDEIFTTSIYEAAAAGAIPLGNEDTPWNLLSDDQKIAVINKGELTAWLGGGLGVTSDLFIKFGLQPALKP